MSFLRKLFSQNSGLSCMRVMSMLSLLMGAAVAFYSLYRNCGMADSTTVVGIFVTSAFGGKVAQKYAEKQAPAVVAGKEES